MSHSSRTIFVLTHDGRVRQKISLYCYAMTYTRTNYVRTHTNSMTYARTNSMTYARSGTLEQTFCAPPRARTPVPVRCMGFVPPGTSHSATCVRQL